MIEVTADQVRKNIDGDLVAIKAALETINASVPLLIGDDGERATLLASSDALSRQVEALPDRVAACSPFIDEAHVYICAMREVKALVASLDILQKRFLDCSAGSA
jgi:hypothetical protein